MSIFRYQVSGCKPRWIRQGVQQRLQTLCCGSMTLDWGLKAQTSVIASVLLILGFSLLSFRSANITSTLEVQVLGVSDKGKIRIALYNAIHQFPDTETSYKNTIQPATAARWSVDGLQPGKYAIAAFQDMNGNGKLDKNNLGIPTEPYGFSGRAIAKWRAPAWAEAVFSLVAGNNKQKIQLRYWKDY